MSPSTTDFKRTVTSEKIKSNIFEIVVPEKSFDTEVTSLSDAVHEIWDKLEINVKALDDTVQTGGAVGHHYYLFNIKTTLQFIVAFLRKVYLTSTDIFADFFLLPSSGIRTFQTNLCWRKSA